MQTRIEIAEKVALAAVAGLLGYLMRTYRRGKKVRLANLVIETASSGLVGYLALLLAEASKIDKAWIGPIVGILGWMGASSSIKVLEHIIQRKLGVEDSNTNLKAVRDGKDTTK